jgi:hypothetical protein
MYFIKEKLMSSLPIKDILEIFRSIDTSLQILANTKSGNVTTAFISKKAIAERMGVNPVTIDKLIYQGITSKGKSGLVEGRHYCKIDLTENNTSNFLYDSAKVLADAWKSFQNYD